MATLAKTKTELPLPVLGQIPQGEYSLGVPIRHDNIQVGFAGVPDGFDRLELDVSPDRITIARKNGEPIQIESGILIGNGHPKDRKIVRREVLAEPVAMLTLLRDSLDSNVWQADAELASADVRVGLSRFAAKMGEAAVKKAKHSQV